MSSLSSIPLHLINNIWYMRVLTMIDTIYIPSMSTRLILLIYGSVHRRVSSPYTVTLFMHCIVSALSLNTFFTVHDMLSISIVQKDVCLQYLCFIQFDQILCLKIKCHISLRVDTFLSSCKLLSPMPPSGFHLRSA